MTSLDSNLLLYCYSEGSPRHSQARAFIERLTESDDVALSELVLVEFCTLLRNPAVLERPLDPAEAVVRPHPITVNTTY